MKSYSCQFILFMFSYRVTEQRSRESGRSSVISFKVYASGPCSGSESYYFRSRLQLESCSNATNETSVNGSIPYLPPTI